MSFQAITWGLAQSCQTGTEKAVLLVLCSYIGPDGTTFVGQETLAREACVSVKTVERSLSSFEASGWISRERRHRKDGSRTSDLIVSVGPPHPEAREVDQPDKKSDRPRTKQTPCPNQTDTVSGLTTFEPVRGTSQYSEPIGSGAEAAPPSPVAPDHDKLAWSEAVRIITAAGVSERSARSFFGKLLSANGLIARDLLPSLTAASVNATGDPQSYLTKAAAAVAKRRGCMEGPAAPNPSAWGDDEWRAAVAIWGESGAWSDALGPPPDHPQTRVPPHLRPPDQQAA